MPVIPFRSEEHVDAARISARAAGGELHAWVSMAVAWIDADRAAVIRLRPRATHTAQEEVEVILLCLNATHEDVVFRTPAPGEDWRLLFDFAAPDLEDDPVPADEEGRPAAHRGWLFLLG